MFQNTQMKKEFLVKILGAAAFALLIGINIASASAQVAITVKNPDPYTGNQSWFIYEKDPGTIIEDTASIKNFGDEMAYIEVYAVDADSSESGSFILKFESEDQKGIGAWTTIEKQNYELAPDERIDVPFKIEIPMNTSPGQYLGGIVAESKANPDNTVKKLCSSNQVCPTGVGVSTRIGARVYLTIPGTAKEDVLWEEFRHTKSLTGKSYFNFKIVNNGNVSYEPRAHIIIYNTLGGIYDEFEAPLGTSLPNTTIDSKIPWTKESPIFGKYTAEARISFPKRFHSASATLLQGSAIEPRTITLWIIPWGIIFILIVLAVIGSGFYTWHLKRLDAIIAGCEKYQVGPEEDIIQIAERRRISWRLLAKINKLKPPYTIRKGLNILVPKKNKNAK
jgi:hypothetical protein